MATINNDWQLKMCRVEEAWSHSSAHGKPSKGEGIVIAHTDTGWTKHPEIYRSNYLHNDSDATNYLLPGGPQQGAEDDGTGIFSGHGTSTASMMISTGSASFTRSNWEAVQVAPYVLQLFNGIRVRGVAPKAQILPFRVTKSVMLMPSQVHIQAKIDLTVGASIYLSSNGISVAGSASLHATGTTGATTQVNAPKVLGDMVNLAKAINKIIVLSKTARKDNSQVGVVSISLGGPLGCTPLENSLMEARRSGVIVCAAAAQITEDNPISHWSMYPGSYPHTVRVAGTYGMIGENNTNTEHYKMPTDGFYGSDVDFTAPGWGLHTARSNSHGSNYLNLLVGTPTFNTFDINVKGAGTSHATAITAGICALWLAHFGRTFLIERYGRPLMTDAFRLCVDLTCLTPSGWDSAKRGTGIIHAENLLKIERLPTFTEVKDYAANRGWTETNWGPAGTGGKWGRI